ncbi:hypothetical protein OEA41_008705 [Lepraria neglecta]|uniref:Uncharacterized protein n=1 Tax=Lepraria neglecta TaxID=209136 RepID=A0AAD9Z2X6_9LECA|nr:hypothetical protein OEA41_008705 [Lepraria neglecta]
MEALPSHHFQSAADSSTGIVFKPDIFDCDVATSNTRTESEAQSWSSPMVGEQRRDVIRGQVPKAATPRPTSPRARTSRGNRHVTFQDPQTKRRLSSVHPALRRRPTSGRAGDIVALDDQIARNGGTTSAYEQLPHRLQLSKQSRPISSAERVLELTRTNGYLLQELAYHKDTQAADMRFHETVMELHSKLEDALKERSQKRADAESTLLSYWGIDFGDGNVEDTVF